ncbi:MAG: arsenic transporter [Gammaproteobacteria bacterium]|nr:arsenic transporter [Gammaproteobacteria bacterium]
MVESLIPTEAMLVSGIILVVTFAGIFTEHVHGFERAKFAMLGAGLMLLAGQYYGFYSPQEAIHAVDWNVVFLLGCMMAIIAIILPTGGFEALAAGLTRISRGRQFLLMALLGTAVTFISLILDNVTTVVIFGPLIVMIAQSLEVSPIPYLMAAALLSDTGGVATLVGDPPNLMIGSAAHIDFNTFFIHMGGVVLASWIAILAALRWLCRRDLVKPSHGVVDAGRLVFKNRKLWNQSLLVLAVMVGLFMLHHSVGWEPWMVAAFGLTLLLFIARHIAVDQAMQDVEIPLLIFFISLFVVVGGVEHSHFLEYIGQFILPFIERDLLTATIVLMWAAAILSAMIDNIPFTAAMIPILAGLEQQGVNVTPLWWGLAVGVGMGGNGTHIGSTANVYIVTLSERLAKERRDPSLVITPAVWFKTGTPAMLATLIVSSILFVLFFEFFSAPIH